VIPWLAAALLRGVAMLGYPLRKAYDFLLKFFEVQKLFSKKVSGGVWGETPQ
jgi:hypothetical protein